MENLRNGREGLFVVVVVEMTKIEKQIIYFSTIIRAHSQFVYFSICLRFILMQYCQLKTRKENLVKLLERMQKFQYEQLRMLDAKKRKVGAGADTQQHGGDGENENNDDEADTFDESEAARFIDMLRTLEDTDIERVRNVITVEELLDCYQHFHLHYGSDLIPMKKYEASLTKSRQSNKSKKNGGVDENQVDEEEANPAAGADDLDAVDINITKYATRKDRYNNCKLAGLNSLAKKFGLSAEQFGENVQADYVKHECDQWSVEPAMLAMEYVREPYFKGADQVLAAARYMLALQFAREPMVKSQVRLLYQRQVCICVRATVPKGLKEIDENHPCYAIKYLNMKPCSEIKEDEYFRLHLAEQDGLVTIRFVLAPFPTGAAADKQQQQTAEKTRKSNGDDDFWDDDEPAAARKEPESAPPPPSTFSETHATIAEKLKALFRKDEFSYTTEEWNKERSLVIDEMLDKYLFVELEREMRARLLSEAKEHIMRSCVKRMRELLNVAPYKPSGVMPTGDEDDMGGLRVLSVVYSTSSEESGGSEEQKSAPQSLAVCALVNGDGELEEFARIRNYNVRLQEPAGATTSGDRYNNEFMVQSRQEKREDMDRIVELIKKRRPHVVIVGAENKDSLLICDEMQKTLRDLIENEQHLSEIGVELVDNNLAKLFVGTRTAEQELGVNMSPLLKQAVCLARLVQDPLLCYAQLCNVERDILSTRLHPLQQTLIASAGGRAGDDSTRLLRMLEIEFVDAACQAGVDLNRCDRAAYTSSALQFVAGLGPRKAQHIAKVLRQQRMLQNASLPLDKQRKNYPVAVNRLFLVTKCTLGRRVFINCAGFIKFDAEQIARQIDEAEEDDEDEANEMHERTDPLDATRIHPETYEWARKIAIDALDYEEMGNANKAIKKIIEEPKALRTLDLDAFADELKRTGHGNKNNTLYDIRSELSLCYRDARQAYRPMSLDERFYCLLNETPQTFYVGKLVLCRVLGIARRRPTADQLSSANPLRDDNTCMWQCPFCKRCDFRELMKVWSHFDTNECSGSPVGVRVMLDNGCAGFVPLKLLSDSTQPVNPDERIKPGMTVHARVRRLELDRIQCELTTRTSDLRDADDKCKPPRDLYYEYAWHDEDQRRLDEKKRREQQQRHTYTKRIIAHPQFKNVGYQQAMHMLREMDIGDALIRPSSKGNDHLTVSWKLLPGCCQHVDVLEEKKLNEFSIGKRLIIEGEDFEDLDEILARYIAPMVQYVREILAFKNYRDFGALSVNGDFSTQSQSSENGAAERDYSAQPPDSKLVESYLLDEYSKNKSRIPYVITCCRHMPGKFMIAYMVPPKLRLREEYIKVTHEGFKFRQRLFKTFANELMTWFKIHYNEIPPMPPPSQSSTIQSLPPPSPLRPLSQSQSATPSHHPYHQQPQQQQHQLTTQMSDLSMNMRDDGHYASQYNEPRHNWPPPHSQNDHYSNDNYAPPRYDRRENGDEMNYRRGGGGRGGFRNGYGRGGGGDRGDGRMGGRGGGGGGGRGRGGRGGRGGYRDRDNNSWGSRSTSNYEPPPLLSSSYSATPSSQDQTSERGPPAAPVSASSRPSAEDEMWD
jgi:transcription elongation factor SPT6